MYTFGNLNITECLVAASWRYSANDNDVLVSINGNPVPIEQLVFLSNNEIAISRPFRVTNGSCHNNVVGVSVVNICGLQSKRSVTALNVERNTQLGALLNETCDNLSGAANENRK